MIGLISVWCDFCEAYHKGHRCPHPHADAFEELEGEREDARCTELRESHLSQIIHDIRGTLLNVKDGIISNNKALQEIQKVMKDEMPKDEDKK